MLQLSQVPGVTVPPAGSASPTAVRRLQKDYAKLMQDPVDGMLALPNEDNILEWHYCLRGSPDTPFHGGFYWGKVIFKENFPWAPPAITMITPNGRFATNTRLCLSISDYHPESWNPGWTVSAILIGLHSFMNENQPAAGSVPGTPQEQKNLAAASKEFNVKYKEFRRFFPQLVQEWTGVYPTADEPDVAPTMLPEHATPKGVDVPIIQNHSSRAAFANRHFDQINQMMNAVNAQLRPAGQPAMIPAMAMPHMQPLPPVPPAPIVGAPMYRELAALAAAQQGAQAAAAAAAAANRAQYAAQQAVLQQQFAVQQNQFAQQQAMTQMMGSGTGGAPVQMPVQVPTAPPPQQRVLRPRGAGAGQDEQNGRRAEMLARLGMEGGQNPGNNTEAIPTKRARRV